MAFETPANQNLFVASLNWQKKQNKKTMNLLIPMAGDGSRFVKEGYKIPKPIIPVSGKPMVIQATEHLPESKTKIYICRDFHIKKYKINDIIQKHYPDAKILAIDKLTEGQASTCLLAKNFINNDEELLISASDNGMIYNKERFKKLKKTTDCLVFTFRNNVTVQTKPEQYGWIKTDKNENVLEASVKVPISKNPIRDHAIVGAFWFKKGKYFVEAAEQMILQNKRINNEFYVDESINNLLKLGFTAKALEIESYICWGTPDDLKTYNYWEEFYSKAKSILVK